MDRWENIYWPIIPDHIKKRLEEEADARKQSDKGSSTEASKQVRDKALQQLNSGEDPYRVQQNFLSGMMNTDPKFQSSPYAMVLLINKMDKNQLQEFLQGFNF